MNIVYCFDNNYFNLVEKSAFSVKKHNENAVFFFFCSYNLPLWQVSRLQKLGNVKFISYDKDILKEFSVDLCGYKHVSLQCFVRFLIPKYLPEMQRALYLDCDTVCKGSLENFYNSDFEENYIIGCEGTDYAKKQAAELGIDFYINSGVLLFNIKKMNAEKYLDQIKTKWRECIGLPRVFSADETIINYVFHKKIKKISEKYNYCYNRPYTGREISPSDVVIWHVTGANKDNLAKLC